MLRSIPLMIVPLILFNLAPLGLFGAGIADPWGEPAAAFGMVSGGTFTLDWGAALVGFALLVLFVEILKATRTTNASVLDHLLSIFVFVAFLIEFLLVPAAAHPAFFLLTVIALIDVLAGFSVSLRAAGRDVTIR